MNNQDAKACLNSISNSAKVAKQESVLEAELELLRSEVARLRRLSEQVLYSLVDPSPECCGKDSVPITTVAAALMDIRTIANEVRENLERSVRILESQLGSLKLEY